MKTNHRHKGMLPGVRRNISIAILTEAAIAMILLTTWSTTHSQRPQQQVRRIDTQFEVLQLRSKPKVRIVPLSLVDVPQPPGNVNESMKARRDYAWEIVKLVWRPVTVVDGKVPQWTTWYEQEDIEEMYNEMLSRQPKPRTHAEIVAAADAVMQNHSVKDLQTSLISVRLGKVLRQFTFPALLKIAPTHVANGTIYYSPSYVKHLLENADNVVRCNLSGESPGGPEDKCASLAGEINSLNKERKDDQKDLQKAAGAEKQQLLNEIKHINQKISEKQQELKKCPKCVSLAKKINSLKIERDGDLKHLPRAVGTEKQRLTNQIRNINQQILELEKQQQLEKCSQLNETESSQRRRPAKSFAAHASSVARPGADNIWAKCMDSEMPPDAFMIKANWTQYAEHFGVPETGAGNPQDPSSISVQLNTPPAGKFIFGVAYKSDDMLVVTDESGQKWMLTGMHIASKAVRTWLWTSLFWGPRDSAHGSWNADVPNNLFPQLSYYMCTVSDFEEKDPTPWKAYADGDPFKQALSGALKAVANTMNGYQWCANPYIETDTARTNCIGCHQGSTESFLTTVQKQRSSNISDFSFSFATNKANFLKIKQQHD